MISSGDSNAQNFQSLIENYEAALKDVTGELDSVQAEQKTIKRALNENNHLSQELHKVLHGLSKNEVNHTFKESDFVRNLQLQLKAVTEEKDNAIKLWQNASNAVEQLENEVRIYRDNTQGLVPSSKLIELKNSYERKLNDLQTIVAHTKTKLEQTINLKTKELQVKDTEITGSIESQGNAFKIIKNLETEVLNLQKRISEVNGDKRQLEKDLKRKTAETVVLKTTVKDCKIKVEEALQVVDAALREKDAALIREHHATEEIAKLSQTLNEFINETDVKIKTIKRDYETTVSQMTHTLRTHQELVKVKESEVENYAKKCAVLEMEIENLKKGGDGGISKVLSLEKNLESTFQKLLVSEKRCIQYKSEMETIKNDLNQMSQYYERDINAKEAEKTALRNEIKRLKVELDASKAKVGESKNAMNSLNQKISTMEISFKEQLKETKNSFQQTCIERQEVESVHNQIVQELQEQLQSQTEINKKWRCETKDITDQLERVITELKMANNRVKHENKMLNERLKDANVKMFEYRKFLETISQDVSKITTITLPEMGSAR